MGKQEIDITKMSAEEKLNLLERLQKESKNAKIERREAYEGLRAEFVADVRKRTLSVIDEVKGFHVWIEQEARAFAEVMKQYGQVKFSDQMNYTITDGDFKLEVKSNNVKGFDERADMAAERLIDYLKAYMQCSEKGADDPMYQMAMTLLERNQVGNLDYKSISKLYSLEDKFDSQYGEIMTMFKEANVVQRNAINYYFSQRDKNGVWQRIEPSFCRM